ncbi:MAG: nucleotidyltransferase family protein [Anaerolineae bacterium]|nr:nucleotidyltransferase family protein [Anaerolineae bacterium]
MTTKIGLGIPDLLASKRQQILEIADRYGAYNVRVFGSVARGEATEKSDIDFLVDFKPDYRIWDQIGLKQDLEALLDCKVDVAVADSLREEFAPYILADATPL